MIRQRFIVLITAILSLTALHAQERGKASYYSNSLHGRRMSSGVMYHRDSMFCAHKRYELGQLLQVTNVSNGKSVIVKVADRGPHARGRIIDLSYAAAKAIGIISAGVAMVEVRPVKNNITVPYKDDSKQELPELDFEISSDLTPSDYEPAWKRSTEDNPIVPDISKTKEKAEHVAVPADIRSTSSKKASTRH
ncbi:MAG: septal ring lytic transglycosylase RlpA family protein [Prevotella sp.]|nr:septal ring lytic transglycosylase RlpA family protein [Prevotella sp.]